jgi:hypothetical protein
MEPERSFRTLYKKVQTHDWVEKGQSAFRILVPALQILLTKRSEIITNLMSFLSGKSEVLVLKKNWSLIIWMVATAPETDRKKEENIFAKMRVMHCKQKLCIRLSVLTFVFELTQIPF